MTTTKFGHFLNALKTREMKKKMFHWNLSIIWLCGLVFRCCRCAMLISYITFIATMSRIRTIHCHTTIPRQYCSLPIEFLLLLVDSEWMQNRIAHINIHTKHSNAIKRINTLKMCAPQPGTIKRIPRRR